MGQVLVPRSHAHYACERSLVCCGEPIRAPLTDEELPSIERALSRTPAGRALSALVLNGREKVPTSAGVLDVLAHEDGRCVHLRHDPGRCALHEAAGLDALGAACRNYPRLVTRLPDERLEVAFNLSCPTASRLLVSDPRPLTFVSIESETFPYPPSREVAAAIALRPDEPDKALSLERFLELRQAWWRELATERNNPTRLIARLALLSAVPQLEPDPPSDLDTLPPLLSRGMTQLEGWLVFRGLAANPERGSDYDALRWPVSRELADEAGLRGLTAAAEPIAEVLHAFVDHQVLVGGLHDSRALIPWLRTAARRAVLIIRLVDALCHRTPFRLRTLLADLVSSSTLVEPLAGGNGRS